jgi:hypothetical protein
VPPLAAPARPRCGARAHGWLCAGSHGFLSQLDKYAAPGQLVEDDEWETRTPSYEALLKG